MMTPGIYLLDLRNVTFRINGRKILDRVSWRVRKGEHWVLLGPNGAGKTTLLRMICGYLWPNSGGEILRNGETLADLGELRKSIGLVSSTLIADIPRREDVLSTVVSGKYAQLGLWQPDGEGPVEGDRERARGHLESLGALHLASRTFCTLSQGEQQKVLISRAMMAEPGLIILDEPCAGMDPGAREAFLASLSTIQDKPDLPGFIYVTHHVEEILPMFTNALALKEGRVVERGSTSRVLTTGTMAALYGISVDLLRKNGRYWPVPG